MAPFLLSCASGSPRSFLIVTSIGIFGFDGFSSFLRCFLVAAELAREEEVVLRFNAKFDDNVSMDKYYLPMGFVLCLNHADIIIPRGSESEARDFYCDFLGFKEMEKPQDLQKNGGLWLEIAGIQVHLSVQDGYDPSKTKAHLAYEVSNLESLKKGLHERGINWNDNSSVPGFVRGDIRDPFGNRIEFLQRVQS